MCWFAVTTVNYTGDNDVLQMGGVDCGLRTLLNFQFSTLLLRNWNPCFCVQWECALQRHSNWVDTLPINAQSTAQISVNENGFHRKHPTGREILCVFSVWKKSIIHILCCMVLTAFDKCAAIRKFYNFLWFFAFGCEIKLLFLLFHF